MLRRTRTFMAWLCLRTLTSASCTYPHNLYGFLRRHRYPCFGRDEARRNPGVPTKPLHQPRKDIRQLIARIEFCRTQCLHELAKGKHFVAHEFLDLSKLGVHSRCGQTRLPANCLDLHLNAE